MIKSWLRHNAIVSVASSLLGKWNEITWKSRARRPRNEEHRGLNVLFATFSKENQNAWRWNFQQQETFVACALFRVGSVCDLLACMLANAAGSPSFGCRTAGGASWSSVWPARRFAAGFEMIALLKFFGLSVVSTRLLHTNYLLINSVQHINNWQQNQMFPLNRLYCIRTALPFSYGLPIANFSLTL
jgi:hypothetical protein